ncbi:MAG: YqjK-like family protein [Sulfuriferula sp.]|nr:YqjK-like family protein [Sulfuriferula sp.]
MMNPKMPPPTERRERLIAQAAAQRAALAQNIESWRTPLAHVDRGLMALRYIKRHPVWIVGGIAVLAVVSPGRAGKWLGRGLAAWKIIQTVRGK